MKSHLSSFHTSRLEKYVLFSKINSNLTFRHFFSCIFYSSKISGYMQIHMYICNRDTPVQFRLDNFCNSSNTFGEKRISCYVNDLSLLANDLRSSDQLDNGQTWEKYCFLNWHNVWAMKFFKKQRRRHLEYSLSQYLSISWIWVTRYLFSCNRISRKNDNLLRKYSNWPKVRD